MKRMKTEWSAILICEIVFGLVGSIFTACGIIFGIFIDEIAASPNSRGDVYVLPVVFGTIGILLLAVFVTLLFVSMKQKKKRKRLIENGSSINACVTEVKQDLFVRVNLQHPYYVICEGINPYTGEKLTFRSANTLEDPAHLLGRYVRVFVDYQNPKNYYVELHRDYHE